MKFAVFYGIAIALQGYKTKSGKNVTPQDVVDAVAAQMHVDAALMVGRSHTRTITRARQIAMYLLCESHGLSTTCVGRFFGRDHSTVVHAIGKIKELLLSDCTVQAVVEHFSEL